MAVSLELLQHVSETFNPFYRLQIWCSGLNFDEPFGDYSAPFHPGQLGC